MRSVKIEFAKMDERTERRAEAVQRPFNLQICMVRQSQIRLLLLQRSPMLIAPVMWMLVTCRRRNERAGAERRLSPHHTHPAEIHAGLE